MPKISKSGPSVLAQTTDVAGEAVHGYSFIHRDPEGSKDTYLSLLGGGSYDRNFNPFYKTAAEQQYENQNFIQWLGNNAAKLGLKTATGVVGAAGAISSISAAANPIGIHQMFTGNMSFHDFFEKNPINQFVDAANVYVDNITPAFTQDGFQRMSFGEQLQNPGDLLTSSIDSLAFMTSSVLAGGLLSKLGVGTKLVSNFAKANSLESILSGAGARNLLGKAHLIDNITAHSVLGVAESATEAADLKKSLIAKFKEERSLGKNSYSDDEIEQITDDRAKNVFWMNMATLSLTNIPFTKLFSKTFSKVPKPDINLGLRLGKDGFEKKTFTGLSKYLYAKDAGTPLFIRNVLTQVVSEGMEESMQHTIQKLNENRNKSYSLGEATFDYVKSFADTSKEGTIAGIFQDDERLKAAGLGAIIGSGATVLSVGMGAIDGQSGAYNEAKAFRNAQSSALKNLNESYTNLISGSVYKKSADSKVELKIEDSPKGKLYKRIVDGKASEISEHDFIQEVTDKSLPETGGSYTIKGKIELDQNGAPILDPVKLKALQTDASTHAGIDDMFDLESISRNDEDRLKLLQRERLATLTTTAIDAGVYDELKERFETALSQADLVEKYGMERSEMEDHIETMKVLKNIHDNVSKDLIAFTEKDIAINEARKKLMFDTAQRVNTLNDLIKDRQQKYEAIKARQGYSIDVDALTEIEVEKARLEREIDIEFQKHSQALITSSKVSTDKLSSLLEKRSKMRDVQVPENLSVSDFKDMVKEAVKLDELIQAKNELVSEYDRHKDMYAPSRMRKVKRSEWLKPYSKRVPLNIDLKSATPKIFDEFLKRKMLELSKEDRRARASSMFYSDAVRDYLFNEIIPIIDPVERHDKLLQLLEEMLKNKVQVTPDLTAAMWEEFQSITTDYGLTDMELDNPYLEYENNEFKYDKLIQALLGVEDSSPDLLTEDQLRIKAIDSLMDSSKSLVSSFKQNPDEFEDEVSARIVLSELEALQKLIDADSASVVSLPFISNHIKNVIIPAATKNRANREVKNQKQVKLYASGFSPILSLDVKYPAKVKDLEENSPLEAAYASIEHLKTLDKDEVSDKLDRLEESYASKIKSLGLSAAREEHLLGLFRSPEKLLKQFILWKYKSLTDSSSMPPAYKNFFKDYSIINLLSNYESMPIEDQEMVQLYLQLTALMDTRNALNSTVSPLGILRKLKEFVSKNKSSGKPAPSSAQMRAIFQLATFISSPTVLTNLGSMTVTLKSPAGSGKSLITIPGALHAADIKPSEVIAVSGTKEASANIGTAIGTSAQFTVEDLIRELDNDKIDESIKVIVFDEAAAAPSIQMDKEKINAVYALSAALARYRNRAEANGNPRAISLVLVYDPNQGVETTDAKTPFEHSYFSVPDVYAIQNASSSSINKGKEVNEETIASGEVLMTDIIGSTYPYSHLLYDTMSLPVTYRSDVPEIVALQNEFLGREDTVPSLVTVASVDPKNTAKDILGTYGEVSPDNLISILNKSIRDNPTRSRVVVVSKEADKAKYAGLGVEVMTINEVAGLTRDEVYVDMGQYTEGSAFLNQKFYTATSRGRLFTYVSGIPATFSSSPIVKEKYEASKLTKEDRHDQVTKDIDTSISLIHEALGIETPSNEVKSDENKKDVDKKENHKKTPDIPDNEPIRDVTRKGPEPLKSNFIATNPNNTVLYDFLQDPSWDRTAKIIHTTHENKDAYVVLVSSANSFYELEIFDKAKADELGIQLPVIQATKTRSGAWNVSESIGDHNSIQVGIDPNSTTIQYRYGDDVTFDFKGNVATLLSKYFSTMYPNPKESIENYDEILSNPSKFISYQAFKTDKDARAALGIRSGGVPVGQPLLIIKGVKLKNGDILKPQYIILRTPKLTKAEEFERFHGDALVQFVSKLRQFTDLTKKINWNALTNEGQAITGASNYANMEVGMRTEIDNNNIFSPFHAFVVALSKAKSGNYSEMNLTLSEKGKVSKLNYPTIPLTEENIQILAPLMEIAREIDVLLHGDAGETDKKRLYQGRAQYAFDRIASANTFIELPATNGKRNIKITRGIRHYKGESGVGETISGMPLLGPVGLATSSGAARMPLVSAKLRDFVRHTATERGWNEVKSIQDFISPELSYGQHDHLVYPTLEELEIMFSKNGFDHLNNGYGLNAPLSFQHLPGDSSMDFEPAGKLETTFVGVIPTTIGIILPGGEALLKAKEQKEKTTLQSYIEVKNKVSSSKDLTLEEQQLFFTEYSKESGNKFKDFDAAAEHYRTIGEKALTFKSQSPTSLRLLKEIYSSSKGMALMLSDALSKATIAFSPTKNSKGTDNVQAPRDFFKSVVLAIALKPRTVADMIAIAEISYKNYKVGKVAESFTQDILRFLKYKKISMETFLGVLEEVKTTLDNIALQRNLPEEAKQSINKLKFDFTEKAFAMLPAERRETLLDEGSKRLGIERGESKATVKYSLEQPKPGVTELFESNPELAKSVYESLGFNKNVDLSLNLLTTTERILNGTNKKLNYSSNDIITGEETLKEIKGNFNIKRDAGSRFDLYKGDTKIANFKIVTDENDFIIDDISTVRNIRRQGVITFLIRALSRSNEVKHGKTLKIRTNILKQDGKSLLDSLEKKGIGFYTTDDLFQISPTNLFAQITPQQKQQAQQLYSQYLDTIFPDSKVKNIVYHFSNVKIDKPSKEKFSLSANINRRKGFFGINENINPGNNFANVEGTIPHAMLFDMKNPDFGDFSIIPPVVAKDETKDSAIIKQRGGINYYSVFEPEQIHILGSKSDIEGFKKFVKQLQQLRLYETVQSFGLYSSILRHHTKEESIDVSEEVAEVKSQSVFTVLDNLFTKDGNPIPSSLESLEQKKQEGKTTPVEDLVLSKINKEDFIDGALSREEVEFEFRNERTFRSEAYLEDIDPITEEEALKIHSRFFSPSLYSRLLNILKGRTSDPLIKIVDALRLVDAQGKNRWGIFRDGVTQLARQDGMVGKRVLLHEVFHQAFNNYLTSKEQAKALDLARTRYGVMSDIELEERLAEDFEKYNRKAITLTGAIRSLFRKIARFLGFTYNNLHTIEALFESIHDGSYTRVVSKSDVERTFDIERIFGSYQNYLYAKNSVLDRFEELLEDYPFEDAISKVFAEVKDGLEAIRLVETKTIVDSDFTEEELSQILEVSPFTALLSPNNLQEFKNAFSPLFLSGRSRTNFKQFASFFFGSSSQIKTLASSLQESRQALLQELTEQKELLENHLKDFEGEDLELAKEQIEELKTVIGDIANETFDSELLNPETKLTGIVRQRMMSVKYLSSEGVQRADLSKVFNSILPLIGGVDNSSLESVVSSVMQRINRVLGGTPDLNTMHRSIRKASAAFIYKEFERFEELSKSRPKNVIIREDIQSAVPYLIMSKDNSDVSLVPLSKAMSDPNYTVSFYEDGLMTEWVASVDAPIEALLYFDQSTFIKGLFGALGSLVQANPAVGIYEYKKGKYHSSYVTKRKSDSEAVVEGDIVEGFKDLVKRRLNTNSEELFPALEGSTIAKLNQILGSLGLTRVKRGELNEDEMAAIVADFEISVATLEAAYSSLRAGEEINMADVILNESSLIDALTIAASTSPTFVSSTSYLRGDGKRAYIWRDASLQTSILSSISAALKGNKSMVFPSFEVGPKGLVPKSPFLKNNLFMEGGLGKIGRAGRVIYVDHDSIKNKGRDYFSKYLHSEKTEHYLSRTFEYGFLNRLIQTKNTYFQFLPIPSNRRAINAVEVKFLNYAESIKALENIIEAQTNRPDPSVDKKYNVATYVKNFDKYLLPGVTKNGKPISVKDITPAEAKKLVLAYYEKQATDTLEKFKKHKSSISDSWEVPVRNWKLDLNKLSAVGKLLGVKNSDLRRDDFVSGLSIASQSLRTGTPLKSSILGLPKGEIVTKEKLKEVVKKHEEQVEWVLKEVLSVYLMNNLVNQYSLSQLLYGDFSFYKNKEDLTKRIQVHTATGDVLLVDEVEGMSAKMRVAVIDDPKVQTEVLQDMHHDSFRETYDENDGWALMLPETFARIAHARGKSMEDDISIKPVHAEVDEEGIPRLLKYSVIVLTDESIGYNENGVPTNKALHNLREAMRSSKIDQAVFASGIKAGVPLSKTKYDQSNFDIYYEENGNRVLGINPASVMEINSKFTRFQLNPAADVDKDVSNFSQITAMINSNGENTAEEYRVHSLNASLIRVGSIIASLRLGINRSGRVTAKSQRHLRERILRTQEGNVRSQNLINLIRSKGQDNHFNVDLALPLISNQIISSLASIVGSATTAIKFPGSKLVLSGAFGTLHPTEQRPLKYKDENGYTEVILPRSYAEFFEEGDTIINDYAMGFRIPSTNYHSAIALKVVGFYDVPEGSKGNIVIAPSDIVHYMGSDYDIDSLFVVKKARATEDIPVGDILSSLGVGITSMEELNIKEGEYAGLRDNKELLIKTKDNNEVSLIDLIEGGIIKIYSEIEDLRRGVKKSLTANELEEMLLSLHKAHSLAAKNIIVHTISANLRDSKNRRDLLTPISFSRVSKSRSGVLQDFQDELTDPEFISLLIESELLPKEKSKNPEFMATLYTEGIDLLRKPEMTQLGTDLVNRYTIQREMSVLEMTVYYKKLREGLSEQEAEEYLLSTSPADLEAEVQPSGFAFDYLTQAEIHNNTYSGIKLTGVSANMAAKTLPYVFAASEVTEIEFRGRTWRFPEDYTAFVSEYSIPSIYEFLRRYSTARVTKREDPRLRKDYHVQIDSHTYTGFTRYEKNDDGSTKVVAGRPVSIYETGDTVTNLSIDNVKEQKLFLLGMTNSSANAWLTGMSMGISLNTLVLMFTTPKMKEVSSMDKLGSAKAKKDILFQLQDETYRKTFKKALLSYSNDSKIISLFDKGDYEQALSLLPLKLDVLKDLHAGRLSDSTIIDYVLYDVTERLSTVGQELFRTAGALNSLKGAASDKLGIDEVVDTFDLYSEISDQNRRASSYSKNKKEILDAIRSERLKELRETEEFKNLSKESQDALIMSIQESPYTAEVDRVYDAAVSAKVISGRGSRNISASVHSVFANIAMLRIPHVYEAWAVHLKLKALIENTFVEHSSIISNFIKDILRDVFVGVNVSNEVFSAARKDFLSYVLSDLKVQTPVGEVDSKVLSSETATAISSNLVSTTLYGKDAWAHRFASQVSSLKRNKGLGVHNENELLKNLEINSTPEGVKFLSFTADKSTNPEVTVRVRAAYLSLLNDDTNYETSEGVFNPQKFALDLFKYGLLSDNMYYERTGLANIFPTSFAVGYSAAFRERMNLFFPKYTEGVSAGNYKSNEIAENLEAMKQDFILQFARNNSKLLPSLRKPDYKSRVVEGVYIQVYQGTDANYAYDIRYPYKEGNPKIITSYQGDVFVLLGHTSEFSYYRKLSIKNKVSVYESPKDPYSFQKFDLSKFKELSLPIVPASSLNGNIIELPTLREDIEEGSIIYIFDYSASKPSSIRKAKVSKALTFKKDDRIVTKLEVTMAETTPLVSAVARERRSLVNTPINYSNVKFGLRDKIAKKLPSKISIGVAAVSVKDGVATTEDILLTEGIYYVGKKGEDHVFIYVREQLGDSKYDVDVFDSSYDFPYKIEDGFVPKEDFDALVADDPKAKQQLEKCRRAR